MTKITVYYAYDETEFYNEEECQEYEAKAFEYLYEIKDNWTLFDKDFNKLEVYIDKDINITLEEFSRIWDIPMQYVKINKPLSNNAYAFILNYYGYSCPPNEVGLYRYNFSEVHWEKIGGKE